MYAWMLTKRGSAESIKGQILMDDDDAFRVNRTARTRNARWPQFFLVGTDRKGSGAVLHSPHHSVEPCALIAKLMARRAVSVEIFAAGDGINYPQKVGELSQIYCRFAVLAGALPTASCLVYLRMVLLLDVSYDSMLLQDPISW